LELKSWYEKARKTAGKRSSEASGRTGELVQRLSYGMRGIATIDIDSDPAASVREARCAIDRVRFARRPAVGTTIAPASGTTGDPLWSGRSY